MAKFACFRIFNLKYVFIYVPGMIHRQHIEVLLQLLKLSLKVFCPHLGSAVLKGFQSSSEKYEKRKNPPHHPGYRIYTPRPTPHLLPSSCSWAPGYLITYHQPPTAIHHTITFDGVRSYDFMIMSRLVAYGRYYFAGDSNDDDSSDAPTWILSVHTKT